MDNLILRDRIALVTGGGRGLGRVMALRLASAGARVAVMARSADQIEETAGLIRQSGGIALALSGDVSDPVTVRRTVETAEQTLGPIDLLVNNAGTGGPFGPFWENEPDSWWRAFEVNMRGSMLCCRAIVPGMVERRRGRIINIASGAGTRPIPYMSSYVTGKSALIRFTEVLAAETQPHGIAVFSIQPGTVRTALAEDILGSNEALHWFPWFKKIFEDGQDVAPDLAADLVLSLASGQADALSGRFFMVPEDPAELVRRVDEIKREDLYTMRLRRLS